MIDTKAQGYGIKYNPDGKKYYQGEWKDDKKHGRGIQYRLDGSIEFNGEWENDKKCGYVAVYFNGDRKVEDGEY